MMKISNLYFLLFPILFFVTALNTGSGLHVDLVFLMVIFAGIFLRLEDALKFGIVAGLLRGFFTGELFFASVVLFPFLAVLSNLASAFIYREHPLVQVFMGMVFTSLLIFLEGAYYGLLHGNINILMVITNSWFAIFLAGVISPVLFFILKKAVFLR